MRLYNKMKWKILLIRLILKDFRVTERENEICDTVFKANFAGNVRISRDYYVMKSSSFR